LQTQLNYDGWLDEGVMIEVLWVKN